MLDYRLCLQYIESRWVGEFTDNWRWSDHVAFYDVRHWMTKETVKASQETVWKKISFLGNMPVRRSGQLKNQSITWNRNDLSLCWLKEFKGKKKIEVCPVTFPPKRLPSAWLPGAFVLKDKSHDKQKSYIYITVFAAWRAVKSWRWLHINLHIEPYMASVPTPSLVFVHWW